MFAYLLRLRDELDTTVNKFLGDFRATARSLTADESMPSSVRANIDVESFRSDNAGEYTSHSYAQLLADGNARREYTPAYTKDPNGIAERTIGVIFGMVRSMMRASGAPLSFWDSAVLNAVDVVNRLVRHASNTQADPDKTPYELLTLIKPSILDIPPFGCLAIATRPTVQRDDANVADRGWKGIACGRSSNSVGAHRVWLPDKHRMLILSDVSFHTSTYPWLDAAAAAAPASASPASALSGPGPASSCSTTVSGRSGAPTSTASESSVSCGSRLAPPRWVIAA